MEIVSASLNCSTQSCVFIVPYTSCYKGWRHLPHGPSSQTFVLHLDQASISRNGVGIISARTRSIEAYSSLMVIDVPNLFFQTDCMVSSRKSLSSLAAMKPSWMGNTTFLFCRNVWVISLAIELWLNLVFWRFEGWQRIWLFCCCNTSIQRKEIHHHGND